MMGLGAPDAQADGRCNNNNNKKKKKKNDIHSNNIIIISNVNSNTDNSNVNT